MSFSAEDVIGSHGPDEAMRFVAAADHFLQLADLPLAASALDRAYGLAPRDPDIARQRAHVLDQLAIDAYGLRFRYVPAGTFLMGSAHGDPDERPVHPVRLDAFWITDAPITWTRACDLLGWSEPPEGMPRGDDDTFGLYERNKLRRRYCTTKTRDEIWASDDPAGPAYDTLPIVGVGHPDATDIARTIGCLLPSEAQWEKAARGGLVGCRYSWGDEPATPARCDCDRMGDFRLTDPRVLPPNGYGLYGTCGGVWEWTRDVYDALAYAGKAGDGSEWAMRGGSFTDCAAACTVSFRASRDDTGWRDHIRGAANVGFRIVSGTDPRQNSRSPRS